MLRVNRFPFIFTKRCSSQSISSRNIRNIGIIAHIDAGKTTVTERLLYLAGATRSIGDVDSGSTVTDYLDIERERGITVQSAAVSFNWNNAHVNLIDTPGHVDFTLEVERCTRVLDGVVTILDSKAGVQAQTRTVWRQATKFNLPSIFFINKLDKVDANVDHVLNSIEEKLNIKGILTVVPHYENDKFIGFMNILNRKILKAGNTRWEEIEASLLEQYLFKKEELCFRLADTDAEFMNHFLEICHGDCTKINDETICKALHSATSKREAAVVSCGSALHSPASVLPLLDQISEFLPSADVMERRLSSIFGNDLSALVFKIGHEKRKGKLSYLRIYTGTMQSGSTIYNANRDENEGPLRLFAPYGDILNPIKSAGSGEIAIVSGLKNTLTGDTLIGSSNSVALSVDHNDLKKLNIRKHDKGYLFSGIEIPEPVYFCSIEPPSGKAIRDFESALLQISAEDPSIKIRRSKDTDQTVIETMGELHLEIIKDKFKREWNLDVFIGPLQIAYREGIADSISHQAMISDEQGELGKVHKASLDMLIEPKSDAGKFKKIIVDLPQDSHPLRYEWQKAISEGCSNALHNGPILGYPVQDVIITLKDITVSGGKINNAILSACAHKCVSEAIKLTGVHLIEPLMRLEIETEDRYSSAQPLLQELAKRRAQVLQCEQSAAKEGKIVALIPLAEMEGLASAVRILTSGLGNLHVEVDKYVTVSKHAEEAIIAKFRR